MKYSVGIVYGWFVAGLWREVKFLACFNCAKLGWFVRLGVIEDCAKNFLNVLAEGT